MKNDDYIKELEDVFLKIMDCTNIPYTRLRTRAKKLKQTIENKSQNNQENIK